MDDAASYIVSAFLIAVSYFSLWFVIALFRKRLDVVDLAWGGGFIAVTAMLYWLSDSPSVFAQSLVVILVTAWGLRLTAYLFYRQRIKPEAHRYVQKRKKWQEPKLAHAFFRLYMVKAIQLVLVSLPIIAIFMADDPFNNAIALTIGFAVFAIGLMVETYADAQLSQFTRKNMNKNKVLDSGLWRYSRHPNYFGEVLVWWGIWIISMGVYPVWWSAVGPMVLTFSILFVSGIIPIEKKMKSNTAYQKYARQTSIFLPLPYKKKLS